MRQYFQSRWRPLFRRRHEHSTVRRLDLVRNGCVVRVSLDILRELDGHRLRVLFWRTPVSSALSVFGELQCRGVEVQAGAVVAYDLGESLVGDEPRAHDDHIEDDADDG